MAKNSRLKTVSRTAKNKQNIVHGYWNRANTKEFIDSLKPANDADFKRLMKSLEYAIQLTAIQMHCQNIKYFKNVTPTIISTTEEKCGNTEKE